MSALSIRNMNHAVGARELAQASTTRRETPADFGYWSIYRPARNKSGWKGIGDFHGTPEEMTKRAQALGLTDEHLVTFDNWNPVRHPKRGRLVNGEVIE